MSVSIGVDGHLHTLDTQEQQLLVNILEDVIGLIGAKSGCDSEKSGVCTPDMLLLLVDCLATNPNSTRQEIRLWLDGVLYRCTAYQNLVSPVQEAVPKMTKEFL